MFLRNIYTTGFFVSVVEQLNSFGKTICLRKVYVYEHLSNLIFSNEIDSH